MFLLSALTNLPRILSIVSLLALGAGGLWWGMGPRLQLQTERADHAEQALTKAQERIDEQAQVLSEQKRQIGQIAAIEEHMRALGQTITRNADEQGKALEELKRNDQAIADYLAGAVPAGLGRLYARPETTDPAAYHGPAVLPADPVPPAGPSGPSAH